MVLQSDKLLEGVSFRRIRFHVGTIGGPETGYISGGELC